MLPEEFWARFNSHVSVAAGLRGGVKETNGMVFSRGSYEKLVLSLEFHLNTKETKLRVRTMTNSYI